MDPVASPSCLRFHPSTRASSVPKCSHTTLPTPSGGGCSLGPVFSPKLSDLPVPSWPSHRPEKLSSYFLLNFGKRKNLPGSQTACLREHQEDDLWPSYLSLLCALGSLPLSAHHHRRLSSSQLLHPPPSIQLDKRQGHSPDSLPPNSSTHFSHAPPYIFVYLLISDPAGKRPHSLLYTTSVCLSAIQQVPLAEAIPPAIMESPPFATDLDRIA